MGTFFLHANEPGLRYLLGELHIPHGIKLQSDDSNCVVIGWGVHYEEPVGPLIQNPPENILRSMDKPSVKELLELNGVCCHPAVTDQNTDNPAMLEYIIPVFHLQALAVFENSANTIYLPADYRAGKPEYHEISMNAANKNVKKIMREAVKAVYALGLDFALVKINIMPGGVIAVSNIDPVPRLNRRLGALFAQAINQYDAELSREMQRRDPVMLGADPEFILRQPDGRVTSAAKFLGKTGPVGCDALILSNNKVIFPLAELRPEPSIEPRELIMHLHRTMQMAAEKITDPNLEWLAGGMPLKGFALGGHIHLSQIWLNSHLLRVLDNYLSLPLLLIEDTDTKKRRPRFGFLGDFRKKSHGGFEYRTPPSWLVSPRVTKGVFALARVIADHYWQLRKQPLIEKQLQQHYYQGNKEKLVGAAREIWADIKKLPSYTLYENYLNPFEQLIFRMQPWNEQQDFRPAWKIPPFSGKKTPSPGIHAIIE